MKKLLIACPLLLSSAALFAEGYQVNMMSTKQAGMGHVGVAMKLGAESMHFNPAGMGFMNNSLDISVGVSAIHAEAKYHNPETDVRAHTHNTFSTPLYAYVGFSIYDNLKAGISLTTPYGSSNDWGQNWVGANMVQKISMESFCYQPTLSWKILDNLSVGAGLMMAYGTVDLSKSLLMGRDLPSASLGDNISVMGIKLHGKSNMAVGYNVGVLWDINQQWSVGASYRSKVHLKVKHGSAKLDYVNDQIKTVIEKLIPTLPKLEEATFASQLPLPANLTVGANYKPTDRWQVSLEAQMVGWKAYDMLEVTFNESDVQAFNQQLVKNYKQAIAVRLGAQYALTERLDLRGGIYFDQSPVRKEYYNPETASMNKIGTSVGCSFRPVKGLSVNFALLYIVGLHRDGSYTVKSISGKESTFSGHYSSFAIAPSLGVSYTFH